MPLFQADWRVESQAIVRVCRLRNLIHFNHKMTTCPETFILPPNETECGKGQNGIQMPILTMLKGSCERLGLTRHKLLAIPGGGGGGGGRPDLETLTLFMIKSS